MIFLPGEEGQGLTEYGLVIILIAIVVFLVLILLGPTVGNLFSTVVEAF
jgi:pilus assembly protein Flp/PilA